MKKKIDLIVEELSTWEEGIEVNESVFYLESQNDVECPHRIVIDQESRGMGLKIVSVAPDNAKKSLPTVPATILLVDPTTGIPQALVGGTFLTGFRTAAGTAVAVKYLERSKSDCKVLSIFGSGLQALCHIEAILHVRPSIKTVRIHSRTTENVHTLIGQLRSKPYIPEDIEFVYEADVNTMVGDADIVVTATSSSTPVFDGASLKDGSMVISVGSAKPTARELDSTVMNRACLVVVDDIHSAGVSGDITSPIQEGSLKPEDIIKLCQVVKEKGIISTPPNRQSEKQTIIFYKSAGTAIQDISTANMLYNKAIRLGKGLNVQT
ncbi:hypothetical protein PPL_03604 [Heterostelium album PN500]|uniref:Ornithine cyclodeaminase n=1 Tax=Heterostelium pallidum (strain ATCC 26659 / Pp 5 / PN500) TaxID=670386 RepID=D3B591_HETP5|nr:hypothetical protein PPL_03604 [Heterostelium album PN500]EFA83456.1 hypothetical protein PPL_03604 [Heterostelium album PN500]|eukprot:XP_020435573.1 hypothetical protein PPL_03604 [Heterostelium album PN500]